MEPALEFSKFVLLFSLIGFVLHHRSKSDRVLAKVMSALREIEREGTKLETATRDEAIEEVERLRRKSFLNTQALIVIFALVYFSSLEWGTPLSNVGVAVLALLYGLYYMGALLGCDDFSLLTGALSMTTGFALLVEASAMFLVLVLGDPRTSAAPWYVFLMGLVVIVSMAASHRLLRGASSGFMSRFVLKSSDARVPLNSWQEARPPSVFERALVVLCYVAFSLWLLAPTISVV